MFKRHTLISLAQLTALLLCLLAAIMPSQAVHKHGSAEAASCGRTKKRVAARQSGSRQKTAPLPSRRHNTHKHSSAPGGHKIKAAVSGTSSSRRRSLAKKSRSTHGRKSATKQSSTPGKKTAVEHAGTEPKEMPANYEVETRLLSKSYQLRDQAANEKLRGDYGEAVKHLSEAVEISSEYYQRKPAPAEAQLYGELAEAAAAAGQSNLCRKSYQECLSRNPKLAAVRIKLAALLLSQGQTEEALTEASRAAQDNPSDPQPHYLLSHILARKGDLSGSKAEQAKFKALLTATPAAKMPEEQMQTNEPAAPASEDLPADMPLGLP